MNFWQRLSRFGIGIVLGIALSLYFFGSRGCGSWLPSAQVRTSIVEGGVRFPEVREAHPALTVSDVLSFVGSADVNFGDSGPRTPRNGTSSNRRVSAGQLDGVGSGVARHGERRAPRRVSGLTAADHLRVKCSRLRQTLGIHLILDVSHLAIGFVCRHVRLSACGVHNALQHVLG